jgi:phosphonate transport system ATP-binding protein
MTRILEVTELSKSFGNSAALNCVSLSVARGEFVVLLGPSGSGKTTLFRCIARLTDIDSGEVQLGCHSMNSLRGRALADFRRRIGMIFQQSNLIGRRTAIENVLAGRLAGIPLWRVLTRKFAPEDLNTAARALETVGLSDLGQQRADKLSGGQQQRVAIARALVQNPVLIIADEPVSSLDPENAISVLQTLSRLARSQNIGVLCSLHQPHLAELFADRLLYMRNGQLRPVDPAGGVENGKPRTSATLRIAAAAL